MRISTTEIRGGKDEIYIKAGDVILTVQDVTRPSPRTPHPRLHAKCGIDSADFPTFQTCLLPSQETFDVLKSKVARICMSSPRMSKLGIVILHESEFPELAKCVSHFRLPVRNRLGENISTPRDGRHNTTNLYESISFGKYNAFLGNTKELQGKTRQVVEGKLHMFYSDVPILPMTPRSPQEENQRRSMATR